MLFYLRKISRLLVFRQAVKDASLPYGLQKYRIALEIFRNFGSNSNGDVTLLMYHGLFALVSDPQIFNEANLPELMEVDRLHSGTFYQGIYILKKSTADDVFNFE